MRKILFIILMLLSAVAAFAQAEVIVKDVQTIPSNGGEAQSTVVPPGKKNVCPSGRFLVTNDRRRPPTKGLVVGRDLNLEGGAFIEATFDQVPNPNNYAFGTNDHDLVTLSNGDVLYLTGAWSRAPLNPKPAWFDVAYRGFFGPGARSNLLVWRSTDCGQTFQYLSEFDPAIVGSGQCALPQFPRTTTPPGSPQKPVFDMGGSDGQLIKVDPLTDTVYLTFGCVGYLPQRRTSHFELSTTPVNKTVVAASYDKGASWKYLGTINTRGWRFGLVPLEDGNLVFGNWTLVSQAKKDATGKYLFDTQAVQMPGIWGWDDSFNKSPNVPHNLIYANMYAHTVSARMPESTFLTTVAYPATITSNGLGRGYRFFYFNRFSKTFYEELSPISPQRQGLNNFLMHMTTIDLGKGPVLYYWYEIDSATKTATIRGRLLIGRAPVFWSEFYISKSGGKPRWFSLGNQEEYWYGDYLTAGGYMIPAMKTAEGKILPARYVYYPMWVEPDGTTRYANVTLIEHTPQQFSQQTAAPPPRRLIRRPRMVFLSKFKPSKRERELTWEYGKRKRREDSGVKTDQQQ